MLNASRQKNTLGSHHPCTLNSESNSDKDGQDDGVTKQTMCVLSVDCINICDDLALNRWQKKRPFCVFPRLLIQTTQSLSALTYVHVHMVVVRGSELERENTFWVQ